jgi:hypothetical protein
MYGRRFDVRQAIKVNLVRQKGGFAECSTERQGKLTPEEYLPVQFLTQ